jgi:hypothetical protein
MIWSILNSDLDSRRKCAAVILQLKGGAQELVRGLPPQAILAGGLINGVAVDPILFPSGIASSVKRQGSKRSQT